MEANETIAHTLEVMKNLPLEVQKKVSEFAEYELARLENKELVYGMMKLQENSQRTFEFLNDGEIYTEKDAIARYDH